ncbi:MAG: DegT/DnrJ/EryC1/StrS family aminotransferase [Bacteroidia bacterium]|nr:DegT/DnrJ/EryC1/StrS family aminotransferase [Bacteroidia bacterium]
MPFIDLFAAPGTRLDITRLVDSIDGEPFVRGRKVGEFSEAFSKVLGIADCIPTGNCTDALFAILKCLGIKQGDEVITPAFSWISSAETVSLCNAVPVFADVDPHMYVLDVADVEKKITARTRAVIAVHLFGQAAPVAALRKVCDKHNLLLIEDCAQAHLTSVGNRYAGTFGDAAAFSFYPTKNLGAYGDAGCIVTNNEALAEKMRRYCNHGALQKDDHIMEGMNSRMDTLQAAVLLAKLPHLQDWNRQRIENAQHYCSLLADIPFLKLPVVSADTIHTFHIFAIRAQRRDQLQTYLTGQGVETIIHYPAALPNLPAYSYMRHQPGDFPVASSLQDELLSLPIYPGLTLADIEFVCQTIRTFYA